MWCLEMFMFLLVLMVDWYFVIFFWGILCFLKWVMVVLLKVISLVDLIYWVLKVLIFELEVFFVFIEVSVLVRDLIEGFVILRMNL